MADHNLISPSMLREALLKLEVNQHTRMEMHLAKEDLREYLRSDLGQLRSEIKSDRNKVVRYLSLIITVLIGGDIWAFVSMKQRVQTALNDEITAIRVSVRQRLDQEFETPRIKALVEEKAREYTAKEAKHYIAEQVESGLKPYQERVATAFRELQVQKQTLDEYQSGAKRAASDLNDQQVALALFSSALSGSRRDFDTLVRISKGNSSAVEAARKNVEALKKSLDQYRRPTFVTGGIEVTVPDHNGREKNLRDFGATELMALLQSETEGADVMRYMMGYLVVRPRNELVKPALQALKTSQFLPGLAATCGVLLRVYGERAPFMDIDGWIRVLSGEQQ